MINSKYPWFIILLLLTVLLCFTCYAVLKPSSFKSSFRIPPFLVRRRSDLRYRPLDPPVFRSFRDRTNGTWQPFGKNISIEGYIYSVFYDDRKALQTFPIVRLIGIAGRKDVNIYCVLRFSDENRTEVVLASRSDIGAGISRHGVGFREFVFSCPLKHDQIPNTLGLVDNEKNAPSFEVPVEVPIEAKYPADFGVCVSVTYWKRDPHAIVEWMELLKILGVSQVTIYNNSIHADSARIFQHYNDEGFVDFRQSHNFISDPGELTLHMHMSPVINDCIYRNMYRFKKLIITDLDEVIIPRTASNYNDMLIDINKKQARSPTYQYVFRNNYFFLDIPGVDKSQPEQLITMRHRKKVAVSGNGYSVKSILDPLSCIRMHNHYCWGLTPLYEAEFKNLDVDPKYGLNQHYKRCHLDKYDGKGACKKLIDEAVEDDIMLKYRDLLIKRVGPQLQRLGLAPLKW